MDLIAYFGCVFIDGRILPVQAVLLNFDRIPIFLISNPAKHFCKIFYQFVPVFWEQIRDIFYVFDVLVLDENLFQKNETMSIFQKKRNNKVLEIVVCLLGGLLLEDLLHLLWQFT